ALVIALAPGTKSIMSLVENAWGLFGAAFGPTIILSLFWKRFNFKGAVAGIFVGALVDILWLTLLNDGFGLMQLENPVGIYEILPGFVCGMAAAVITTLCTKKPSAEVEKLFDDAVNYAD
ncbi:MAG: sodium:proline symporter, partial [Clostridia bacterium]|nr:sodium:proline symporter [Clostridia bacterium]